MSMDIQQVKDDLRAFVKTRFEIADTDADFDDEVHLFDYGYVDSFGAVEILTHIDEKFNVKISDEDLIIHPLNTIDEIATLVHSRLEG